MESESFFGWGDDDGAKSSGGSDGQIAAQGDGSGSEKAAGSVSEKAALVEKDSLFKKPAANTPKAKESPFKKPAANTPKAKAQEKAKAKASPLTKN